MGVWQLYNAIIIEIRRGVKNNKHWISTVVVDVSFGYL